MVGSNIKRESEFLGFFVVYVGRLSGGGVVWGLFIYCRIVVYN